MARRLLPLIVLLLLVACDPRAREARELRASCSAGDAAACDRLGYQNFRGDHVLRDWRRAADLFQAACDGGEGEGCVRLARLHVDASAERRGVAFDSTVAARLLEQGCDRGMLVGCTELGDMYAETDSVVPDVQAKGVLQDFSRAASLYGRACDGGELPGCARLGVLYRDGTGVERDAARAVALYTRACDGGAPLGCARLGEAYAAGTGVDADPGRAADLFEKACASEMIGCFRLAELLVRDGGSADRAVELFDKACDGTLAHGDGSPPVSESCFRLGEMYANGSGVDRDVYRAGSYFRRACRLGYQEACRRS